MLTRKAFLLAAITAVIPTLAVAPTEALAQNRPPPPPMRRENRPPPPRGPHRWHWQSGHWAWRGGWVWIPGRWVR